MPIDPTNPGGPGGPNNQNPGDPARQSQVFTDINKGLDDVEVFAGNVEVSMKGAADQAERMKGGLDEAGKKMKDLFNMQEKLNKFAKDLGKMDQSRFKNAEHAHKFMKDLVEMYKATAASSKTSAAEAAVLNARMKSLERTMGELPKQGELLEGHLNRIAGHIDEAQRSAKGLVTAMAQLGRHSAAIKGATGILGAMGIGKGFSSSVERRLEQAQEIKQKIQESKELRSRAIKKHMTEKREKSLNEIAAMGGDFVDATGKADLKKPSVRKLLTEKMFGQGAKSKEAKDFLRGEISMSKGGEAGAGYEGAMQSGGGAIAKVMSGFEDGIMSVVEGLEGVAVPLMLVVGAIYLLVEAFDSYVKQNKDMESKLGKGGLFTTGNVGDAFNQARRTLTPGVGTGVPMGITFERNLALAGGMAQNYNISSMMKAGQANVAGMLPGGGGALGGFAGGGLGELQRTVFGGARAAGLTDTEGMEEVLKMIDQYGETLASTETFFVKLNKDTAAAGISTTKYLKIIDEVSGHFDRMNKSLEQTTGMMRDLSRYGAISGESLKDMMEFLTKGGNATPDKYSQRIFQEQLKSPEMVETGRKAQADTLTGYLDNVNDQIQRLNKGGANLPGFDAGKIADIQAQIAKGNLSGAQDQIESVRSALQKSGMSDKLISGVTGALDKASQQVGQVFAAQSKDAGQRTGRAALMGDTPVSAAIRNIQNVQSMAKFSGMSMEDLISGKGGGATSDMMMGLLGQIFETTDLAKARQQFAGLSKTEVGNRVQDIRSVTDPAEKKKQALAMVNEMIRQQRSGKLDGPLLKELKGQKGVVGDGMRELTDATNLSGDALLDFVDAHRNEAAATKENQSKVVSNLALNAKISDDMYAKQIDDAKAVAERTQTVEDILKNTFAPLLNDIVSAVEFIANKMGFGLFHKDAADLAKDFAADSSVLNTTLQKTQDSADAQEKHLAEMRKTMAKGGMSDEAKTALDKQINEAISKLSETEKDLAAIQQAKAGGRYTTEQQEQLVHGLMAKRDDITQEPKSTTPMKMSSDLAASVKAKMDAMPAGASQNYTPGAHSFQVQRGGNTYIFYSTDASMVGVNPQGTSTGGAPHEHTNPPANTQPGQGH